MYQVTAMQYTKVLRRRECKYDAICCGASCCLARTKCASFSMKSMLLPSLKGILDWLRLDERGGQANMYRYRFLDLIRDCFGR